MDFEAERQERERAVGRKKKEHALQQVRVLWLTISKRRHWKPNACTKNRPRREITQNVRSRMLITVFSEEAIAEEQRAKERRARIRAAQKTPTEEDDAYESDDSFM